MSNRLDAMVVREGKDGKSFWTRIGVAFQSRNGGWTVRLDATPLDGVIHLMVPRERGERSGNQESQQEEQPWADQF